MAPDVQEEKTQRASRALLVPASLVIVVAGLRAAAPILLPLLLAVLLSILSLPLLRTLVRHRVPKLLAVIATVFANLAVVAALLLPVGGSITAFIGELPRYQAGLEAMSARTIEWLDDRGIDTTELMWLRGAPGGRIEPHVEPDPEGTAVPSGTPRPRPEAPTAEEEAAALLDLSSLVDLATGTIKGLAALASRILLVLFIMIFILFEASGLPRKIQLAFRLDAERLARILKAQREIHRYLAMKTAISLATGLLLGMWMWLLEVDYPFLWGLLAFLLNYIPNLGSIIASVPPTLLTLIERGWAPALMVAFAYLTVNMVLGNFLEPHLMGRRLGLSTLVVFLSLVFWGWLWGPVGMLLSVPLTMMLKISLENIAELRWLALLLGPNPPPTPPAAAPATVATPASTVVEG